jgi:hypothetical protein
MGSDDFQSLVGAEKLDSAADMRSLFSQRRQAAGPVDWVGAG